MPATPLLWLQSQSENQTPDHGSKALRDLHAGHQTPRPITSQSHLLLLFLQHSTPTTLTSLLVPQHGSMIPLGTFLSSLVSVLLPQKSTYRVGFFSPINTVHYCKGIFSHFLNKHFLFSSTGSLKAFALALTFLGARTGTFNPALMSTHIRTLGRKLRDF